MPFLVDGGPPVDAATLTAARTELPREYGTKIVDHAGHKVLLVRVPRAKPDYNYELAVVALYTSLEDIQGVDDVLLIGDEMSVRMAPLRLRDNIREQTREDKDAAPALRARLAREYGWTTWQSPTNNHHKALALRLPVGSVSQADEGTLLRARAAVGNELVNILRECQHVYLVADSDFGRVGRRVFVDGVAPELAAQLLPPDSHTANPLHLCYQTPGGFLKPMDLPRG
jgi:hypothetical protein